MGLTVRIFSDGSDCTNNGQSSTAKGFTLTNVDGPSEPSDDYPAAKLVAVRININNSTMLRIIPDVVAEKWNMFGGNFGYTSDSRFSRACEDLLDGNGYGAVKIFDRVE